MRSLPSFGAEPNVPIIAATGLVRGVTRRKRAGTGSRSIRPTTPALSWVSTRPEAVIAISGSGRVCEQRCARLP
jgi:hypothetical protein